MLAASAARRVRPCRAGCGRPAAPRKHYCSVACRIATTPSARHAGLLATTRELVCALPGCDVAFTTRKPNRRFCSKAHLLQFQGERSGRGAGRHFPRVRYAPRQAIFERDGWTCQLCGAPIERTRRFPHPGSASIDHRDPNGSHDASNWQAAHLACNITKSGKVAIGAAPELRAVA